jgi:hypothetical protein
MKYQSIKLSNHISTNASHVGGLAQSACYTWLSTAQKHSTEFPPPISSLVTVCACFVAIVLVYLLTVSH